MDGIQKGIGQMVDMRKEVAFVVVGFALMVLGGFIYIPTGHWPGLVIGLCGAACAGISLSEIESIMANKEERNG